jgi:CubicO group peptidase (beta-lactamase class C family)
VPGVVVLVVSPEGTVFHEAFGKMSLSWAGINNTFFWIDPQSQVGVVVMMQFLPFHDDAALSVLRGVESRVYLHLLGPPRR